jgi:hypothetical protein
MILEIFLDFLVFILAAKAQGGKNSSFFIWKKSEKVSIRERYLLKVKKRHP